MLISIFNNTCRTTCVVVGKIHLLNNNQGHLELFRQHIRILNYHVAYSCPKRRPTGLVKAVLARCYKNADSCITQRIHLAHSWWTTVLTLCIELVSAQLNATICLGPPWNTFFKNEAPSCIDPTVLSFPLISCLKIHVCMLHHYINTNCKKIIISLERYRARSDSAKFVADRGNKHVRNIIQIRFDIDISQCSNYYQENKIVSKPSDGHLVFGKMVFCMEAGPGHPSVKWSLELINWNYHLTSWSLK